MIPGVNIAKELYSKKVFLSETFPQYNILNDLTLNDTKTNIEYDPEQRIYSELLKLSKTYNFSEVYIEDDEDNIYKKVFIIDINNEKYDEKIMQIWDEIIDKIENFCLNNNLMHYFQEIAIVLR